MARQITETLREPALLPAEVNPAAFQAGTDADQLTGATVASLSLPGKTKEQMQHQGVFEQVADHIRREPVQSTRLLEAWIGSVEEMD
jgi:flagellar M-ring protein FliF